MLDMLFAVWDMTGVRVKHYYQDRRDIYKDVGMVVILYIGDFVEVSTLAINTDNSVVIKKGEWKEWKYYNDYEEAYRQALECI